MDRVHYCVKELATSVATIFFALRPSIHLNVQEDKIRVLIRCLTLRIQMLKFELLR